MCAALSQRTSSRYYTHSYLSSRKLDTPSISHSRQTLFVSGEYFTAVDLSDIARELDEAESAALDNTDEDNEGSEAKKSQNMDDTGFFSVQVCISFQLQNST